MHQNFVDFGPKCTPAIQNVFSTLIPPHRQTSNPLHLITSHFILLQIMSLPDLRAFFLCLMMFYSFGDASAVRVVDPWTQAGYVGYVGIMAFCTIHHTMDHTIVYHSIQPYNTALYSAT